MICPHCFSEVLFDLWVTAPIADDRTLYRTARGLEPVVAELPLGFLDLKRRLAEAPGIVIPKVTRATASACAERLEAANVTAKVVFHEPEGSEGRPKPRWTAAAIGSGLTRFVRERPGTAAAALITCGLIVAVIGLIEHDLRLPAGKTGSPISTQELALIAEHATVQLSCGERLGAGFFVAPDLVVTNAHVLCPDTAEVTVTSSDGRTGRGRVLDTDEWLDVGLVRVSGVDGVPLELADVTRLERGDPVVMMGSPHGMDFTLTRGIVSHPSRQILGISYLQVDAGINPGNSGGPLLEADGRAVGIVSMMVGQASNLGLALPVNYLADGPDALLANRPFDFDRDRWRERLQVAAEADRKMAAEARNNVSRPGLVAARFEGRGSVTALVVRWSDERPGDEHFSFDLSRGGAGLCSPTGDASRWRLISDGLEFEARGSRYMQWLERHHLARGVFASPVSLNMSGCPDPSSVIGSVLALRSGAPEADRVVIGADSRW